MTALGEAATQGMVVFLSFILSAVILGGVSGKYVWKWYMDQSLASLEKSLTAQITELRTSMTAQLALKDQLITYLIQDRDDWREMAEGASGTLGRSVEFAEKATDMRVGRK